MRPPSLWETKGDRRSAGLVGKRINLLGIAPTLRCCDLAADVFVCSKRKRSSAHKAVEAALFPRGIFKLNVTPLRIVAGQHRPAVEYSVAPKAGGDNPIAAPGLIGDLLRWGRRTGGFAIGWNGKVP